MIRAMTQPSPLYQLLEARLNGSLADFVAARWPLKGWRKVAEELSQETGVAIGHETLRLWFAGRIEVTTTVRTDVPASTGSAAA
jgi:hypothetical protein